MLESSDDRTRARPAQGSVKTLAAYKTIFASSSVGLAITEPTGRIIDCNRALTDMLGYRDGELLGRMVQDINHPDDAIHEEELVRALNEHDSDTRLQKRFVKHDGGTLWADLTIAAVFEDGAPTYVAGIVTDITESVTGRATIERLSNRVEAALRGGNMAWWELELPSGRVEFDEFKAFVLGYRPEQFTHYADFMALVHPDDYEPTMDAFRRHLDGLAETYTCEYRIRNADGEYLWFRDIGRITSRTGGIIRLTGIVTEITEHVRIREELEAAHRRFLTILQHIKVGILVVARHSREILYANPYIQSFYEESLEHKLCTDVFGYKPDLCSVCPASSAAGRDPDVGDRSASGEYELPLVDKDFLMQASPIEWTDGQDAAVILLTDVSSLKEVEQLKEEIERITRHDLKNPLSGIIGGAQLLLIDADESFTDDQRENIRMIEESGKRMLAMIDESLGLYKIEKGLYEVRHETVDLDKVVMSILQEYRWLVDDMRVDMTVERNPGAAGTGRPFSIRGEKLLCYSTLSNIVRNALDASQPGDHIAIRLHAGDGDRVSVAVWNRAAIPKEISERFGSKYATWGKNRGTGLGVYSARLMTESQGGEFSWESSPETGTTIRVGFPAADP